MSLMLYFDMYAVMREKRKALLAVKSLNFFPLELVDLKYGIGNYGSKI